MVLVKEKVGWKAKWIRYNWGEVSEEIYRALRNGASINEIIERLGVEPDTSVHEGNVALNEGLEELIDIICGLGSPTLWDNTNARLGVGDSNAAEDASQTGLQGSNKAFKGMDSGYPQKSGQTAIWRATFGGDEANFSWQEFTIVNASDDSGKNLNRKVADKGTKSSGETWTFELRITFS